MRHPADACWQTHGFVGDARQCRLHAIEVSEAGRTCRRRAEQQAARQQGLTMWISPGRQAIAAEMGSLAASLQALAAPVPSAASQPHDQPASASPSDGAAQQPASSPGG